MSSEEVLEKVKGIIVEQLGVAEKVVTVEDVVEYIKENVK